MTIFKKSILFLSLLSLAGTPVLRAMEEELDKETLEQIAQMEKASTQHLPAFGTLLKTDTDLPRLFQPPVTYQSDGTTCGYRAAIYAKALDELFASGETLNSVNINRKADQYLAQYVSLMSDEMLHADEIMRFIASELGNFNNYYIVGKKTFGENPEQFVSLNTEKVLQESLPGDLQRIAERGGCIHFICNQTGPHWALLSLIKSPDKLPFFLYIDSKNGYLSKTNIIFKGIENLYEKCAETFPHLYEDLGPAEQQHLSQQTFSNANTTSWLPTITIMAAAAAAFMLFFSKK